MAKSNTKSGSSSYKFYNMGSNGLKHDVMCGTGVAIPAGTKNEEKQKYVPMNVYMAKINGAVKLIHA